ncbi:MAG TPA: helix-hairpin-helix domain-containing protein [Rubrobacteraceae bacterium]|nr:helix-hairpin-helix domain-containing protein [Rubrobacteraceae bacterium]
MAREDFETAKKRPKGNPRRLLSSGFLARYKPQIVVGALVVALLAGGAYYSSRVSESAPKVVYSTSFDEAKAEAQAPLLININTADAKELDELPEVGPSPAEKIIEYRRHNGSFKSVDELEEVHNYKSERELRFRALVTESGSELELARV